MEIPLWDRKWIGRSTDDLRCVDLYLVPEMVYVSLITDERVETIDINDTYTLDINAYEWEMQRADLKCNYRMITVPRDVERVSDYTFCRDVSKRVGFAEYVINEFERMPAKEIDWLDLDLLSYPMQPYTRHYDDDDEERISIVTVFTSYEGSAFKTYNIDRLLKETGFEPPRQEIRCSCRANRWLYWKYPFEPFRLVEVARYTLNREVERLKREFSFYETLSIELVNERRVPFNYDYSFETGIETRWKGHQM